jgi:hypothetical protein
LKNNNKAKFPVIFAVPREFRIILPPDDERYDVRRPSGKGRLVAGALTNL